jgi:hypothetical protein
MNSSKKVARTWNMMKERYGRQRSKRTDENVEKYGI